MIIMMHIRKRDILQNWEKYIEKIKPEKEKTDNILKNHSKPFSN